MLKQEYCAVANVIMEQILEALCPKRLMQLFECVLTSEEQNNSALAWNKKIKITDEETYYVTIKAKNESQIYGLLSDNYATGNSFVLLDALMEQILEEINNHVSFQGKRHVRYATEFDCEMVCKSVINDFCEKHHICNYPLFTLISEKFYEGKSCAGRIVLCQGKEDYGAEIALLSNHLDFNKCNIEKIRKLLEATGNENCLLVDALGQKVIGIGKVDVNDKFVIEFQDFLHWKIKYNGKNVFAYEYYKYNLFDMTDSVDENAFNKYSGIVRKIVANKHGAILIIAKDIENEADRLCNLDRGYRIEKGLNAFDHEDLLELATRMDGAVMLNEEGECLAMGVILDGIAAKGSTGHGSRHNSTKSYVEWRKDKYPTIKAIVVSEDGPVTKYRFED